MSYVPANFIQNQSVLNAPFMNNVDQMVNNVLGGWTGTPTVGSVLAALGLTSAAAITTVPVPINEGGTGANTAAGALVALGGAPAATFPITPQETNAGVNPVNLQYSNSPHDIRRYAGWHGDGLNDDSAAWMSLAAVMAQGGNGVIPPGPTYVAMQVSFSVPAEQRVALWAYGVELYTNNGTTANAIDGFRVTGGGNSDSMTVYGMTYFQLDAVCTTGFYCNLSGLVTFVDCQVVVSSSVAANGGFACFRVLANTAGAGYWNKFIRCSTRQYSGNAATQAPFSFFLSGAANATTIRDCYITSTSYGVGMFCDSAGNVGNAVLIDGNHFEGGNAQAIIIDGAYLGTPVPAANVSGLRITNNRFESWQGVLEFYNLGADSAVPTFLSGNYLVSSSGFYIGQNNQASLNVSVNSWDQSITPPLSGSLNGSTSCLTNYGPFTFYNIAAASGDTVVMYVQNATATGNGWSMQLGSTPLASCRYKVGGGVFMNLVPGNSGYQIAGITLLTGQSSGYGTPTGGAHQASFAAGSITLPNLAAAVAQLIVDLKAGRMPTT